MVSRVQVEEEGNQRAFEARPLSGVTHESAPADLRRAFRIEKSEPRADDDVILFDTDPDGAGPLPDNHTWQLAASDVGLDGSPGGAYDLWSLNAGGTVAATLAIDADVEVSVFT